MTVAYRPTGWLCWDGCWQRPWAIHASLLSQTMPQLEKKKIIEMRKIQKWLLRWKFQMLSSQTFRSQVLGALLAAEVDCSSVWLAMYYLFQASRSWLLFFLSVCCCYYICWIFIPVRSMWRRMMPYQFSVQLKGSIPVLTADIQTRITAARIMKIANIIHL